MEEELKTQNEAKRTQLCKKVVRVPVFRIIRETTKSKKTIVELYDWKDMPLWRACADIHIVKQETRGQSYSLTFDARNIFHGNYTTARYICSNVTSLQLTALQTYCKLYTKRCHLDMITQICAHAAASKHTRIHSAPASPMPPSSPCPPASEKKRKQLLVTRKSERMSVTPMIVTAKGIRNQKKKKPSGEVKTVRASSSPCMNVEKALLAPQEICISMFDDPNVEVQVEGFD